MLSDKDKEYLPKNFLPEEFQLLFYSDLHFTHFSENFFKQDDIPSSKAFIIFYNTIGLKQNDFLRVTNLIPAEEASVVILKSKRGKVALTCSNVLEPELFNSLLYFNRDYNKFLNQISGKDILIHTLEGIISIDDFEDLKMLYFELSKKESLSYCSKKIHESFNDLFVEYKELLNV